MFTGCCHVPADAVGCAAAAAAAAARPLAAIAAAATAPSPNRCGSAASLEPTGLGKLIRDLKAAHKCMSFKPTAILDIEQPQRKKLKWGQYNKC